MLCNFFNLMSFWHNVDLNTLQFYLNLKFQFYYSSSSVVRNFDMNCMR